MRPEAAKVLKSLGLAPESFAKYADRDTIGGEIPGKLAIEAWTALRQAFPATGLWPLIRGGEFDPSEREASGKPPAGTVDTLLEDRFRETKAMFAEDFPKFKKAKTIAELAKSADESGVFSFEEDVEDEDGGSEWPTEDPERAIAFQSNRDIGSRGNPVLKSVHLSLVPVTRPHEVFLVEGFGGYNECPEPALLAAVFREWDATYGAVPCCLTHDVVECVVAKPPQTEEEAMTLAAQQWILCDDIVSQGTQSVRKLAIELWRSPTWFFWWD